MKQALCGGVPHEMRQRLRRSCGGGHGVDRGIAANEPKPAPPRPVFFAAAAAANIKPVSVEQREERRFLKDAAAASRFQSEAARLALNKSNDAGVRSFAATLINHDAAVTTTLQHMLHVRAMAPPMLDNAQRKTLNRLAKMHGKKFDREFMEEVALKHQLQEVEQYEKANLTIKDPALKAWIANNLPTLRYHLATAERARRSKSSRPRPLRRPRPPRRDPSVPRRFMPSRSNAQRPGPNWPPSRWVRGRRSGHAADGRHDAAGSSEIGRGAS